MRKSFLILSLALLLLIGCAPSYKIIEYGVSAKSLLANREIRDLSIKKDYGITILKVKRNGEYLELLRKNTKILPKDTLYLLGTSNKLYKFRRIFH